MINKRNIGNYLLFVIAIILLVTVQFVEVSLPARLGCSAIYIIGIYQNLYYIKKPNLNKEK